MNYFQEHTVYVAIVACFAIRLTRLEPESHIIIKVLLPSLTLEMKVMCENECQIFKIYSKILPFLYYLHFSYD